MLQNCENRDDELILLEGMIVPVTVCRESRGDALLDESRARPDRTETRSGAMVLVIKKRSKRQSDKRSV